MSTSTSEQVHALYQFKVTKINKKQKIQSDFNFKSPRMKVAIVTTQIHYHISILSVPIINPTKTI